jgi:glycosyltransferase involved in cell wall biosynthesis
LSELEGGPIPLIEAMMSNVIPVATRTGFAPDVINHGTNGYLCNFEDSTATISHWIDCALSNKNSVRSTVEHLSWERFSHRMLEELGLRSDAMPKPIAA